MKYSARAVEARQGAVMAGSSGATKQGQCPVRWAPTNVLDNRKWAVPCRWFKSIYNEERNLMTYQPFYVDENKTKYYDTLLWEIMFRTHSLRPGTMLQIDKVPLYPIDPQIKKYDRPFAVKTRQFQAVIKQCRSDENLYQES